MLDKNGCLDYDWWVGYRKELYDYYPKQKGIFRIDLELINPTLFLTDVEVFRNPHGPFLGINGLGERVSSGGCNLVPQHCMYCCDDWSIVFEPIPYTYSNGSPAVRMIVESNHPDPTFGERIVLLSSFHHCWSEPWGFNKPNLYVFYQNKFWFVSFHEFSTKWKFFVNYPLCMKWRHLNNNIVDDNESYTIDDFREPSYFNEEDDEHSSWFEFVEKVLHNEDAGVDFLAYVDYFHDEKWEFSDYLQKSLECFNFRQPIYNQFPSNARSTLTENFVRVIKDKRKHNARTAKLFLLVATQLWKNRYIFSYHH